MAVQKSTISKKNAIVIIADLLFSGKQRGEIVKEFIKTYNASTNAIDKWIKEARPIVADRQAAAERIKAEERDQGTRDVAKRLNISKEAVLEGYAKIAFFDIRTIFNEDGTLKSITEMDEISAGAIAGVDIEERKDKEGPGVTRIYKFKMADKRSALDGISKVMGYNAPVKVADTDKDGNDKPVTRQVIIVNGQEIEF